MAQCLLASNCGAATTPVAEEAEEGPQERNSQYFGNVAGPNLMNKNLTSLSCHLLSFCSISHWP